MTSVHPTRIEAFGTHCSLPECHLGDFLPFTCTYCTKPYCSSHRTPESHQCPAYDAAAQDVRATICPLCQEAIPVSEYGGRNADINIAMDAHFENGRCKVLNQQNGLIKEDGGNAKKLKGQYQCKFGRCENRNWADIRCDKCGKGYCPSHREPKHHKCAMASTTASSSSTNVNLVPAKTSSSSSNTGKPSSFPVKAAFSKLTIASPTNPNASSAGAQSGPSRPHPRLGLGAISATAASQAAKMLPNEEGSEEGEGYESDSDRHGAIDEEDIESTSPSFQKGESQPDLLII